MVDGLDGFLLLNLPDVELVLFYLQRDLKDLKDLFQLEQILLILVLKVKIIVLLVNKKLAELAYFGQVGLFLG